MNKNTNLNHLAQLNGTYECKQVRKSGTPFSYFRLYNEAIDCNTVSLYSMGKLIVIEAPIELVMEIKKSHEFLEGQ